MIQFRLTRRRVMALSGAASVLPAGARAGAVQEDPAWPWTVLAQGQVIGNFQMVSGLAEAAAPRRGRTGVAPSPGLLITAKRGRIDRYLTDWFRALAHDGSFHPGRAVLFRLSDADGRTMQSWSVAGATPLKIQSGGFSAKGGDWVSVEEVTFSATSAALSGV